jgi:excisionase family DNA binding protein
MLTTKEVAEALGISIRQVQTLIERDKLPAQKLGRDYVIQESDLKLVENRPKGRPPKAAKKGKAK